MIPLFPWLEFFPRMVLAAGLISGFWHDIRGNRYLKQWMQHIFIVSFFCYYLFRFSRTNPVEPVISVLAIMLAVRLGGEKTVRNSLQLYVLSMFCLASSSLFDVSPVFLVYLGLLLFLVTGALVLLTFQNQDTAMTVSVPDLKRILFFSLLMPVLAVPLLLILFPVMPRTQLPLWNFLNSPATRTTGFSDSVEPGSHSSIVESRTLAFRAEMPRQGLSRPYWRGTVFNRTDGCKWTRTGQLPAELVELTGQMVSQIMYPEVSGSRTLVALDRPAVLTQRYVTQSPDGVFELSRSGGRRMSYTAVSQSTGIYRQRNSIDRPFYLQLPDQLPDRIRSLASDITRSGEDDRARVELLEKYFHIGNYRYATTNLSTGDKALEQFLFETKQGNCEFFASSFALLLRAAGVPCRLVGGFLGGEYNELGGYYLVTDNKAHVWVEAYIERSGWMRVDPSSFATNAGEIWPVPKTPDLILRVALVIDSLNYLWNRSVISYDFEQQMKNVYYLGLRLQGLNPLHVLRNFAPYFAGVLLLSGLLYAAGRAALFRSREQRILRHFLRMVEREFHCSARDGEMGLFEIVSATNNRHISDFVAIYAGAVYHDRKLTDEEYLGLQQLLRRLKRGKGKKNLTLESRSSY